ncbi:NgoBV family restriction endonuclease [Enterococcus faecalis]|nr:NgoBV family restriction endonuclease [Enterococcus faecalis]EGO5066718.1 NgoBV family restriction endonuclease [Enterococcus faecalis]EGO5077214.1 NgoBV family restriction endonuclease [Enterococcus faecalis]
MVKINSLEELFIYTKQELEGKQGNITINFANHPIVYSGNDIIGNSLQEWLPSWFTYLDVDIKAGKFTQEFPDFVARFDNKDYDVEVKAWNCNNNPGFDIANFHSFIKQTYSSPGKINAYFIILGYKPAIDGFSKGFIVEKVYLKRIWEITNKSKKYPIGLQVKRSSPYAIRPCSFHKKASFNNKDEFIHAIYETFKQFPNESITFTPEEWLTKVKLY